MHQRIIGLSLAVGLLTCGALAAALREQPPERDEAEQGESERQVPENEVPKAALDALKKLAGGAPFTEFAEEIEYGHTFYEGSWKGTDGNVDAVVTPVGDLVALEEVIANDKVPATAREAMRKAAGKDAKIMIEKKTMILYEAHWTKDGKGHEMIVTPDGRRYYEDAAGGRDDDDDDDDKGRGEDEDEDEGKDDKDD